jgi:hypothetical protein
LIFEKVFGQAGLSPTVSHCTPELTPIWWRRWLGAFPPPKQLQKSRVDAPSTLTKGMKSPRPKRLRKERVPWEAAVASTLDAAKKAERKAPRTSKTDALKPIPLEPLPPSIERPLSCYTPPLHIRKKQGRLTFSNMSSIDTFKRFICVTIIKLVVISTNAYAERKRAEDTRD